MKRTVRVGTRGSRLALAQANMVIDQLRQAHPDTTFAEVIVKTTGDKVTDVPLFKVGGQGLFIKEIEEALVEDRIDLAIHSLKDVPHKLAPGLILGAISERKDARDVLISRNGESFFDLPAKARIGTSSLRRRAQLLQLRDDLTFTDLRGNLDTRLKKLEQGEADAIVLAAAGLLRLGVSDRITSHFSIDDMTPAAGQGLLGLECREKDLPWLQRILNTIESPEGRAASDAERTFLARLQGGCQIPLAVHARFIGNGLMEVLGFLGDPDSREVARARASGPISWAVELGEQVVADLHTVGAADIMARWTEIKQQPQPLAAPKTSTVKAATPKAAATKAAQKPASQKKEKSR